ncbi:unnamed protein product [Heligmosomoides polygyrus]|uniref:Peptidase S1 domain-containing protein n=1 Tax=Heligmosomoides polygyrus TaxID=6339 RepID=A0A3P7ZHP8_HELPZ|nr:unnamed protein product [Heligmosomoides polygyrus]
MANDGEGVHLSKLTKDEDQYTSEHCGYHYAGKKEDDNPDGGAQTKRTKQQLFINQFPWITAIRIRGYTNCSGVLISPRHVLTAARCVLDISHFDIECLKGNERKLKAKPGEFTVQVGSRCTNPNDEFCEHMWTTVEKVTYHENFDECALQDDIAVLELKENVDPNVGSPICMPSSSEAVQKNPSFITSGFGLPRGPKGKAKIPYHKLLNVYMRTKDKLIFTAVPPGEGICETDIGGPLFNEGETNTLLGVESTDSPWDGGHKWINSPWIDGKHWDMCALQHIHTAFTDVRSYKRWICTKTGVCSKDAETSTDTEVNDKDMCNFSSGLLLPLFLHVLVLAATF